MFLTEDSIRALVSMANVIAAAFAGILYWFISLLVSHPHSMAYFATDSTQLSICIVMWMSTRSIVSRQLIRLWPPIKAVAEDMERAAIPRCVAWSYRSRCFRLGR